MHYVDNLFERRGTMRTIDNTGSISYISFVSENVLSKNFTILDCILISLHYTSNYCINAPRNFHKMVEQCKKFWFISCLHKSNQHTVLFLNSNLRRVVLCEQNRPQNKQSGNAALTSHEIPP